MRRRLIPNWVSLAVAAMYPLFAATSHTPQDWPVAIAVAAAMFATGFGRFAANMLGGGDAKLMSAVALWAGPGLILTFLFVMTIAGGLLAIAVLLRQRLAATVGKSGGAATVGERMTGIPYGVAIAVGGLTVAANLYSGM